MSIEELYYINDGFKSINIYEYKVNECKTKMLSKGTRPHYGEYRVVQLRLNIENKYEWFFNEEFWYQLAPDIQEAIRNR